MSVDKPKPKRRRNPRRMELIKAAIVVTLIGLVLRIFVFLPFKIKNTNMENTLYNGDFLLTSQLAYRTGTPQPDDLIVFNHPFKVDEATVGRVIAIEGQTVEIIDKVVYVDNQPVESSANVKYVDNKIIPPVYSNRDYVEATQVPAGAVYVLSDNRDDGEDSRNFGFINIDSIKGRGLFVYWSWRPDPNAPEMESPYITPAISILLYNLVHFPSRIGWDRIGAGIN
jgi:signal peptidase I